MKFTKIGVSLTLSAALLAGFVAPAAYADDAKTEKYLVSLEEPANAQWDSNSPVFAGAAQSMTETMKSSGIEVDEVLTSVGVITADMTEAQAEALKKKDGVLAVDKNREMTLAATQSNAPWHLDRLDQSAWNFSARNKTYKYDATGNGVTAYIVDSGVYKTWPDINGRVTGGVDFGGDGKGWQGCVPGEHGTKVATSLGGKTYGVAKNAKFVSVRVFPCSGRGTGDMLLKGIDWVMKNGKKPSVVNMSLSFGGAVVPVIDQAVQRMVSAGYPVVVAAGNESLNSCNNTPSRVPEAVTVAATDKYDQQTSFSNYGSCVDVYAPGQEIQFHTDTQYNAHGTSFAAPMVAGAVAQYLEVHPSATPAQISNAVVSTSFKNQVKNTTTGTPNRMLNALGMSRRPYTPKWTMSHVSSKVVGTHSYVWGKLPAGATTAWTEVKLPTGQWSRSQTRKANAQGVAVIPLTYGLTKPGKYTYRVGTTTSKGTQYTDPFVFTRTALTVKTTARAKIYSQAYLYGKVPTAKYRWVVLQVQVNGKWKNVTAKKAGYTGYVRLPLTWGRTKPGTYTYRALFDTPYGKIYSKTSTVVRYR